MKLYDKLPEFAKSDMNIPEFLRKVEEEAQAAIKVAMSESGT
ncbi:MULTISPECIES: hypothetical protein [Paenibacillus]|nr:MULTISPECIES: hypothetical protein [Paenibacillus]